MKIVIAIVIIVLLLVGGAIYWIGSPKGPSLEQVAHLQTPRLNTLPAQKVLLVTAKGNPNKVGKQAFGLLMRTYFQLPDVPKFGPGFKAPRARWPISADVPADEWIGHYAMPVPESITELPEGSHDSTLQVELTTWEYGEVAEILHVGPYDKEKPTVEKLTEFIKQNQRQTVGDHEEEYLKGPGMFFSGNPDEYLTIIRYRVEKVEGSVSTSDDPS